MSSLDLSFLFLLTSVITPFPQGPTLSASSVLRSFLFPFSFFFPFLLLFRQLKQESLSRSAGDLMSTCESQRKYFSRRTKSRWHQGPELARRKIRNEEVNSHAVAHVLARRRTESLIVVSGLSSRRSRRRLLSPPSLAQLFARPPPAIGIGVRPPTRSQTITRPSWHPLRLLHAEDARP